MSTLPNQVKTPLAPSNPRVRPTISGFCTKKGRNKPFSCEVFLKPIAHSVCFVAHAPNNILKKNLSSFFAASAQASGVHVRGFRKKTKTSRLTTLRAPKHFKVGRHHYQVESRFFRYFWDLPQQTPLPVSINAVGSVLKNYARLAASEAPNKPFSTLTSYSVLFEVKNTWVVY